MLAHFPRLLPDELLYSGLARYHLTSGNNSEKQTIKDLFGNQLTSATIDLPSNLNYLSEQLHNAYSVETLIRKHTIFPYYSSFLNTEKSTEIYKRMVRSSPSGEVHITLGMPSCRIKSSKYLKFCKVCYTQDTAKYTEPYWHRAHQIPGVNICHIHEVPLTESNIRYSTTDRKFMFAPLVQIGLDKCKDIEIKRDWQNYMLLLAKESAKLLNSHERGIMSIPSYTGVLSDKGYISPTGRIKFVKLTQDFRNYYTDEFLEQMGCDIKSYDSWFHKMMRDPYEVWHPLRHLLFYLFLDINGHQIKQKYLPFGEGPWPCLNKAAEHFGKPVVEQCTITRSSKDGIPIGTFSCECGFIYSRSGPDKTKDARIRIGRIKSFGHTWYQKLNELSLQDLSLRKIANLLGVDPGTVKRQNFHLHSKDLKNNRSGTKKELLIRRKRFLNSLNEANSKNISVRSLNGKDYTWLYRHDCIWLGRVIRKEIRNQYKSQHTIVDWQKRDEFILKEIQHAVSEIKEATPPKRITVAATIRNIENNLPVVLEKCLHKLPRASEFLYEQIETTEQFQIRRLEWTAKQIREGGNMIIAWRLQKTAGLKKPLSKRVQDRFNEIINSQESN
ncbi:TnsD family Tn7-like transposition protein [Brevibacillus panacihumi]|nr:TnsD family Tn7-like transposition protein [Brevibacillus panacihumi]